MFETTLIRRVIISDSSADRLKALGINTLLCCAVLCCLSCLSS